MAARSAPIAKASRTSRTSRTSKSSKAERAQDCHTLEQLPNIGPSLAAALRRIGIQLPRDLAGKDGFALYQQLCTVDGQRQDPCVLDTFLALTDFLQGAPAAPWWHYTAQRKRRFGQVR